MIVTKIRAVLLRYVEIYNLLSLFWLILLLYFFHVSEMTKDNIDEIVLVGGTTRIPKVKQQLRWE